MRHLIPPTHTPGRHCASTSLADLVNFHGLPWSEAFCFGLGSGLGLWYLGVPGMNPSRIVHVRSGGFEQQFFERIGVPFRWERDRDPVAAERHLKDALADRRPAILLSDIYYLPYYNSSTHFPGHCIGVWGYDEERGTFLVTDTERPDVLEVPFEKMRDARYSDRLPFQHEGDFFAPASLAAPADLPERIVAAIRHNAELLLQADNPVSGIGGLDRWISELPEAWPALPDWQWAARFAYQTIEKRGTGGGGFRLMYADFLREAEAHVPRVRELGLAERMQAAGEAWCDLAFALKALSEMEAPDTAPVLARVREVRSREAAAHERAMEL